MLSLCQSSEYFVTLCVFNRENLFGEIADGKLRLNDFGRIAEEEWKKTGIVRENVDVGDFVVMPNHLHGILAIRRGTPKIRIRCFRVIIKHRRTNQVGYYKANQQIAKHTGKTCLAAQLSSHVTHLSFLRKQESTFFADSCFRRNDSGRGQPPDFTSGCVT